MRATLVFIKADDADAAVRRAEPSASEPLQPTFAAGTKRKVRRQRRQQQRREQLLYGQREQLLYGFC